MSPFSAIRWSGALWLVPVALGLGVWVGLSNLPMEPGYPVQDFTAASREVVLVGPLLAAILALRSGPLLSFLAEARPQRRPVMAVLGAEWPLLLGVPVAALLAMASASASIPLDLIRAQIAVVVVVTILACGCLGVLFARVLPTVIAVPTAALVCFAWLALPTTGSNVLLRNINSSFVGCCTSEQQPAQTLLLGSFVLTAVLIAAIAAVFASHGSLHASRLTVVGGLTAALVVSLGAGATAAQQFGEPMTLMAVQDRTTDPKCVESQQLRVCLWPEHENRRAEATAAAARVNAGLARWGADPVRLISEDVNTPGAVRFSVSYFAGPDDIAFTVAQGILREYETCRVRNARTAYVQTLSLLSAGAGLDRQQIAARTSPASARAALRIVRQSPSSGAEYLKTRLALLSSCNRSAE